MYAAKIQGLERPDAVEQVGQNPSRHPHLHVSETRTASSDNWSNDSPCNPRNTTTAGRGPADSALEHCRVHVNWDSAIISCSMTPAVWLGHHLVMPTPIEIYIWVSIAFLLLVLQKGRHSPAVWNFPRAVPETALFLFCCAIKAEWSKALIICSAHLDKSAIFRLNCLSSLNPRIVVLRLSVGALNTGHQ